MRHLVLILLLACGLAGPASAADPVKMHLVLRVTDKPALEETAKVVRQRLEAAGIDADVDTKRDDRIVVDVPEIDDPERIRRLLQGTAALELRLSRWPKRAGGATTRELVLEHFGGRLPPELEILEGERRDEKGWPIRLYYAVERKPVITGLDIKTAKPTEGEIGSPAVVIRLHDEAARTFASVTEANVGSGLAIVLDGRVVSVPMIRSRISDEALIEGLPTANDARDLAAVLTTGPLPTRVEVDQEETTSIPPVNWVARLRNTGGLLVALVAIVLYIRHLLRTERERQQAEAALAEEEEDDEEDTA